MKGFKPTGYGPSAGFKFPARMGFTGSTGSVTNVSPYIRRKAFADGGFVRQDNPRMKSEEVGDQGSALIRRAKSYNNLDQESGGKTPLRPGFRKGGRMKKADGGPVRRGAVLPRRQNPYTLAESVKAIPEIPKELLRTFVDKVKRGMASGQRGMVNGKNQSIDEYVASSYRARSSRCRFLNTQPRMLNRCHGAMMTDTCPDAAR